MPFLCGTSQLPEAVGSMPVSTAPSVVVPAGPEPPAPVTTGQPFSPTLGQRQVTFGETGREVRDERARREVERGVDEGIQGVLGPTRKGLGRQGREAETRPGEESCGEKAETQPSSPDVWQGTWRGSTAPRVRVCVRQGRRVHPAVCLHPEDPVPRAGLASRVQSPCLGSPAVCMVMGTQRGTQRCGRRGQCRPRRARWAAGAECCPGLGRQVGGMSAGPMVALGPSGASVRQLADGHSCARWGGQCQGDPCCVAVSLGELAFMCCF